MVEDEWASGKGVKVISINPSEITDEKGHLIDLTNTPALRNWLLRKYQGKKVKVKDDGRTVAFYRNGIESSVKKRGDAQRQMYADLASLVENGVYAGFVLSDTRHPTIERQNIYYAAAKIGDKMYGVKFKIDVFKGVVDGQYKDHRIAGMEIEKSLLLYVGFDPYQQNSDSSVSVSQIREAFLDKGTANFAETKKKSENFADNPQNSSAGYLF